MVFSHDGLRDSLTRLAAPPFLYESLKREISLAERNKSALTAIAFTLKSDQPIYDYPIVTFSEIASRAIRLEDHVARMGADNFVALISGGVEVAEQITSRICAQWTLQGVPGISLLCAWISHQIGESALDFLNRLDAQDLDKKEF
jgi:GGDEF domain-containing protein